MTKLYDWENRENKETIRVALFRYLLSKGVKLETYVCLPGWDGRVAGLDIYEGMRTGVITPQTKVIGYECNPEWAQCISQHFSSLSNITIVPGRIEDFSLDPNTVDFAFLDFTGTIDQALYKWFENVFAPSLKTHGSFAVTLPYGRQTGNLLNESRELLTPEFIEKFPGVYYDHRDIAIWLFILKSALHSRKNCLRKMVLYNDNNHVPMVVFLFNQVEDVPDPMYCGLGAATQKEKLKVKKERAQTVKEKRVRAAQKAVTTRHAKKQKRHEAALKAWRTRRANAVTN